MKRLLFLLVLLGFGYMGYRATNPSKKVDRNAIGAIDVEKEFPLTENKGFVVIVYAHNDARFCERALESIFHQDYENYRLIFIDDASIDGTYEKAHNYVLDAHEEDRTILIRNDAYLGRLPSLYRAIDSFLDKEIVLIVDGKDWLCHPFALIELNSAFQNPDVWSVWFGMIDYPSYEKVFPQMASLKKLLLKEPCSISSRTPIAFYARLFKEISLLDLLKENGPSYQAAILTMSGGRTKELFDPLYFQNGAAPRRETPALGPAFYEPLSEFPSKEMKEKKGDLLLFSYDRPLQLFACLESVERYASNFEKISVIYRASSAKYSAAYDELKERFSRVSFIQQSDKEAKKEFKPLVLDAVFNSPSEYIVFGVDDLIMKDFVDLRKCIEMMEKTKAYGFYLRFGKHINFCYQNKKPQKIPSSIPLSEHIFAWDLKKGEHDWAFANTVDMTLFRKKDLEEAFRKMRFKTPNSLEFIWASEHAPKEALGLYFEVSKVVNLPLNVVTQTGNPHMNFMSPEALLEKFEEGLKIDIEPLYRIENNSPHYEYTPEWTLREGAGRLSKGEKAAL